MMAETGEYIRITDGYLEVRQKLSEGTRSASGKTLVVYSTRGNVQAEGTHQGKPVTVGVNAYQK